MNIIRYLIVFSALGLVGSISPMERVLKKPKEAIRVLLEDGQEGSLAKDQFDQLKQLCPENIQENLNVQDGSISLPGFSLEEFEVFINNLDAIADNPASLRLFTDAFDESSDIKGYKALVRVADYLGIEKVMEVAFAWLEKNIFTLVRNNPVVAQELLELPFTYKFSQPDDFVDNVLCYASEKGYLDIVKSLLEYGLWLYNLRTAFMCAVAADKKDVAELLIEEGADLGGLYELFPEMTALEVVAEKGFGGAVNVLFNIGHTFDWDYIGNKVKRNPFFLAVKNGHEAVVSVFLKKMKKLLRRFNAGLGQPEAKAWTRMRYDDVELLAALMKSINKIPKEEIYTPLMAAVKGQYVGIVKLLLSSGALVNVQCYSDKKNTALMMACENGNLDIVELLLDCEAYVDFQNSDGKNALMIAEEKGHSEIVALLKKHGAV